MKKYFLIILPSILSIILISCNQPSASLNSASKKEKGQFTVALLPFKNFDTTLINEIKHQVEVFYKCNIIVLSKKDLPKRAFYVPRQRYKADSLLTYEKDILSQHIDAMAGLTDKDISTSHNGITDWGIFGLGMCPGKVCVISVYRLQRASKMAAQLKERLVKVVLHELGHNLGLAHCTNNSECLMTDADGTIMQVDREKKWLCESCRFKLSGKL